MIKKLLYLSPLVLFFNAAIDVGNSPSPMSSAAPPSSTGAPGEVNCTTSGCHETYAVNSGPGSVSIIPQVGFTNYTPGQTYTISISVTQSSITRFGFQMVALKDKDSTNTGTFSTIDGSRNQIEPGYGNLSNRRYVTYTFKSTNASSTPGNNTWSFKWTAPTTGEGSITFYAAGLAANNDGMDMGDYCYTTSYKINSNTTQISENEFSISTFPNPIKDKINVNYTLPESSNVTIDLVDLQGEIVENLFASLQDKGDYKLMLPLANRYKGGVYFIHFERDNKLTIKKVFITD